MTVAEAIADLLLDPELRAPARHGRPARVQELAWPAIIARLQARCSSWSRRLPARVPSDPATGRSA